MMKDCFGGYERGIKACDECEEREECVLEQETEEDENRKEAWEEA